MKFKVGDIYKDNTIGDREVIKIISLDPCPACLEMGTSRVQQRRCIYTRVLKVDKNRPHGKIRSVGAKVGTSKKAIQERYRKLSRLEIAMEGLFEEL